MPYGRTMKVQELLTTEARESSTRAQQLAAWLGFHGLNGVVFAKMVGCSQGYISRVMAGTRTASADLWERIEAETGVPAPDRAPSTATAPR